jgi:DNA-binding response OmpR family regulator
MVLRVLVLGASDSLCDALATALLAEGHLVFRAERMATAQVFLDQDIDVLMSEPRLPDGDFSDLQPLLGHMTNPPTVVLLSSSQAQVPSEGGFSLLSVPVRPEELQLVLRALIHIRPKRHS